MDNLFDQAERDANERIGNTVRSMGGNLFDEAAIRNRDPSKISDRMKQQAVTDDHRAMIQTLNDDMSLLDTLRVGVGRGATTIARAVGLAEPEAPVVTEAFNELIDGSGAGVTVPLPGGGSVGGIEPKAALAGAGEIVGEALPFLPMGLAAGGVKSLAGRVLANAGVGALEGAAITAGRGGDSAETATGATIGGIAAGAIESFMPVLSRLSRALFKRLGRQPAGPLITKDGGPTPEFKAALDEGGTTFEGLVEDAYTRVNQQGVDPAQAARAARFESQGVPASKGDISQVFDQQAQEQRLAVTTSGKASDDIRTFRLQQSEAFKGKVNELVDSLGVPDDMGASVKAALTGRKKLLTTEKNALYKEFADAAPDLANMPIMPDGIAAAVPGRDLMDDLAITAEGPVAQVKLALARFGVDQSDEAVKLLESRNMTAQPLTLANHDRFAKLLKRIQRDDITGAASNATGPILDALDNEVALFADNIKMAEGVDSTVLDSLKAAQQRVRTLKTEFDPRDVVGGLIGTKRGTGIPLIEQSRVSRKLLAPGAPIEHLQRTLSSLNKSGPGGKKAIKDMQATVLLDALDAALKAPSRKTAGIETVGGNQFAKTLAKFGDDKLDLLFRSDPQALAQLRNLKQTALDMSATSGAIPKGSAAVNMDIASNVMAGVLGMAATALPGVGMAAGPATALGVRAAAKKATEKRALKRMLDAKPDVRLQLEHIRSNYPAIASAFGIAAIQDEEP